MTGVGAIGRRGRIDHRRAACEVVGVEQRLGPHVHVVRIGDVPVEIGVGELLRLDEGVEILGRVVLHRGEVVSLEHLEHLERGDALTGRREFPEGVALVVDAERLDPARLVALQILDREIAAERGQTVHDLAAEISAVEDGGPTVRDALEGSCEIGVPEPVTRLRCLTVEQEGCCGPYVAAQAVHRSRPVLSDDRCDREALVGNSDGRSEHLGEGHGAIRFDEGAPPRERTRDRDGAGPGAGHTRLVFGQKGVHVDVRPGLPARIQADESPGFGIPQDGEHVTAHPGHVRLGHIQDRGSGHGRIDGVPSRGQNLEGRRRRQRLARGRDIIRGVDGGTTRIGRGTSDGSRHARSHLRLKCRSQEAGDQNGQNQR